MLATLAQRRLTWFSPQLERAFLPIQRSAAFKIDAMRRLAFRRAAAIYRLNHLRLHGGRSLARRPVPELDG